MADELKIKMGADVAGAVNGIRQVNNELNKTGPAASNAGSAVAASGGQIQRSTRDYTNFGRVIQDLPFGFIGIQNNLTQLIPAIGGVGIAFSVLIAGLTFAQTGLDNWTRGLSGSKSKLDENAEALAIFQNQLEESTTRVDALTSSLEFLNKLGKLRVDIALGKGLKSDLVDLQAQTIANRDNLPKLIQELDKLQNNASAAYSRLFETLTSEQKDLADRGLLEGMADGLSEESQKILKTYQDLRNGVKDISEKITDTERTEQVLRAQITQTKIDIVQEEAKKTEEAEKKRLAAARKAKAARDKLFKEELESLFRHEQSLRNRDRRIAVPGGADFSDEGIRNLVRFNGAGNITRTNIVDPNTPSQLDGIISQMNDFIIASNLSAQAVGGIGDAFAAMGTAFLQGSSGMKAFFSTLKNAAIQLLAQLIKTAAVAAILSAITGGAGSGGLNFMGAFKGILGGSIKGFASGGLVFGDTLARVGEGAGTSRSNPEVIAPLDKLKQYIGTGQRFPTYLPAFEVRGDTLRAWYAQSNKHGRNFI